MNITDLLIILNLVLVESLLSVDNAAVLAVMVKRLPEHQRAKALRYGLIGAYVFRGLCLLIAGYLMKFAFLKIFGGLYLWHIAYKSAMQQDNDQTTGSRIERFLSKLGLSIFVQTIIMVELMDLAFSIDNVFAAVALSNKFWIVMTGVGIGILAMRFVAGWFVKLMDKFPKMQASAMLVVLLLGVRLVLSGSADMLGIVAIKSILSSHVTDILFSASMLLILFIPLLMREDNNDNE